MPESDHPEILFERVRSIGDRRLVRRVAARLCTEISSGRPFTCKISDDAELRRLNREFLGRDKPTDVLSFPSASPAGWLGEMAISADHARRQALARGHTIEQEIGILMLHGLLHLMGMDHTNDRGRMRRAETAWREALGLPDGLIERAGRAGHPA